MRIGFSTGAVAFGDFRLGLERLSPYKLYGVELSALRENELEPLIDALDELDLAPYKYISFHAPSRFDANAESRIVRLLRLVADHRWPIVCHPEAIIDANRWAELGSSLCFENMDKRKPVGRTADELDRIFERFPNAGLCLDLGHAWQVDRTMSEARQIIRRFRQRIRQVHVSEVNTNSEHVPLTLSTATAFSKVAQYIPGEVTWMIESVVAPGDIGREIEFVRESFSPRLLTLIAD
jgi:hypothetical protein